MIILTKKEEELWRVFCKKKGEKGVFFCKKEEELCCPSKVDCSM